MIETKEIEHVSRALRSGSGKAVLKDAEAAPAVTYSKTLAGWVGASEDGVEARRLAAQRKKEEEDRKREEEALRKQAEAREKRRQRAVYD